MYHTNCMQCVTAAYVRIISDQQSLTHRGDLLSNLDSDDPVARTLFKMVDLSDKVLTAECVFSHVHLYMHM